MEKTYFRHNTDGTAAFPGYFSYFSGLYAPALFTQSGREPWRSFTIIGFSARLIPQSCSFFAGNALSVKCLRTRKSLRKAIPGTAFM